MIKSIYSLRISCSTLEQLYQVSELLNIKPTKLEGHVWHLEVEEGENDEYFDFINYFLDIIEGKLTQLESVEVLKSDISIWFLYQYLDQCNMNFLAKDLKRLGNNGIDLCVSCWTASVSD